MRLLITTTLLFFLVSCGTTHVGKTITPEAKLKVGESRIADVVEIAGTPFTATRLEQGISLTYYMGDQNYNAATYVPIINMVAGRSRFKIKHMVTTFDSEGLLVDLKSEEGEREVHMARMNYGDREADKLAVFSVFQKFDLKFNLDEWKSQKNMSRFWGNGT